MRVDSITVHRPGMPPLRVIVIRIDARRRARVARALAAAGYPFWQIRSLTRLSARGLARALAEPHSSLWGRHAAALRAGLAEVA